MLCKHLGITADTLKVIFDPSKNREEAKALVDELEERLKKKEQDKE